MPYILILAALAVALAAAVPTGASGDTPPLYEEEIAASNPGRTEQARELETYLAREADDRSALRKVFTPDYSSPQAYEKSARKLRQALADTIGYPPPGQPDAEVPEFRRIGEDAIATYYRTRISVLPGVHVIGLYLVPKDRSKARRGRLPLVISLHGGDGSPEVATFHGGANYNDMVRGAAKHGYAVYAPQHLFKADGYPADIRPRMDHRARLIGTSITAIEIAKIRRGLDVVLQRPEIDPKRAAMVGLSYGSFYTLYTTALEPRIRVAVASCFFGDLAERMQQSEPDGWGDMRFSHGVTRFRDPEIAALICPRPLEIQMGRRDTLIPIAPGRRTAPLVADYYHRLGRDDNFRFVEFDGSHEFHGATAWEWLEKHL